MTLLGLSFTSLATIFGVLGGGLTILYILKLRRRRIHVPFAQLWSRVLKEKESTSLFRHLKRLLSLLVQLIFLILLTGALGDPRLSDEVLDGRHIMLLIDTSASMKATDTDSGTRLEAALEKARELIRGLGGTDSMMIVRMDAQITPLTPFSSDDKNLLKALEKLDASDTRADLPRALKFAADALRGRKNPLLIIVGDGAYDKDDLAAVLLDEKSGKASKPKTKAKTKAKPKAKKTKAKPKAKGKIADDKSDLDRIDLRGVTVRYVSVGHSRDNVGIVAFSARRYPTNKLNFEVFLEVVNYRKRAMEVDLQLYTDGTLSEVQRLSLKAGQRARFSCGQQERAEKKRWCEMAASGEMLEARLVPAGSTGKKDEKKLDAFPLDDHAYALLPKRRKQKVLLVSTGNLFLEGALLLDDNVDLIRLSPKKYTPAALNGMEAVIFDGFYPTQKPTINNLLVNPPVDKDGKGTGPFAVKKVVKGPLITEQNAKHPVMRWITLKDVNIASSSVFVKKPGDDVLAASFRDPLVIARTEGSLKIVALGFDPRQSDLPLRVAFPILIINTFHWFAGDGEGLVNTYRTGQTWKVPLRILSKAAQNKEQIRVMTPSKRLLQAPVHQGQAILFGREIGVYQLGDPAAGLRLAANLSDSAESNIRPRSKLSVGGRQLKKPTGFGVALRREIWIYLLLAALGLTLLEWATYNRRMTV